MTNEYDNILSELEKTELQKFTQNIILEGAVQKILLYGAYYNGTLEKGKIPETSKNFALQAALHAIQNNPQITNDNLGQGLRSSVEAVRLIDLGFQELKKFKKEEKKSETSKNESR